MKARTFALRPPIGGCVPGFVAWAASFIGLLALARHLAPPPLAVIVLPALAGFIVTLWLWPPTVRVGSDGLWIGRMGRRELIPIGEIEGVDWVHGPANRIRAELPGLVVRRRGKKPIELPMLGLAVIHRDELYAAIEAAMAAAAVRRSRALAPLDRAGRALERWRQDLSGMLRGAFATARSRGKSSPRSSMIRTPSWSIGSARRWRCEAWKTAPPATGSASRPSNPPHPGSASR